MRNAIQERLNNFLHVKTHIAPLAVLRIAFGSIMLLSTLRFLAKGWVYAFYIKPRFHFTFYGFEWVKPLGASGIYVWFTVLIIAALLIILGLFYRLAILTFFIGFTYIELIDKTTYLNHYYLISVMAFLMIWVPANRYFSLDVRRKPLLQITHVPQWTTGIFKLQLVLVYFFAGVSKLTYDWLIAAIPLKIWLPANSQLPVIGGLLTHEWLAYVFSWCGMLFDLLIGFFLLSAKTRKPAYAVAVIFHLVTGLFFKIGMFPYIMIGVTVIFFAAETHLKIIALVKKLLFRSAAHAPEIPADHQTPFHSSRLALTLLALHFAFQILLPLRYLCYPGTLYWTEEGYRFSWRVMLMEKGGTAFFHVKDPVTGRQTEIINSQYLSSFQETQMATQPDMILQYAHFLAHEYQLKGIKNPIVTADSYVTLNGSGSRLYIDPTVNLAKEHDTFSHKKWIRPFKPIE